MHIGDVEQADGGLGHEVLLTQSPATDRPTAAATLARSEPGVVHPRMATAGPALDDKALPADAGPGARGRRRALRLLALSYLLSFGGIGLQVPLLSPSLGLGAAVIGGLWAVRSATGIVAPALLGLLADRLRADRALASLCLLGAGASLMGLVFIDGELGATISFAAYGLFGTASVSLVDGMVLTALGPSRSSPRSLTTGCSPRRRSSS
jgi:hypothetical protein